MRLNGVDGLLYHSLVTQPQLNEPKKGGAEGMNLLQVDKYILRSKCHLLKHFIALSAPSPPRWWYDIPGEGSVRRSWDEGEGVKRLVLSNFPSS